MAKIPFDIKYRPQIESGEYKVIDRFGYVLTLRDIINDAWYFSLRYPNTDYETERIYDHPENHLFLVTPEEELTEFENRLCEILDSAINHQIHSTNEEIIADAKKLAKELLSLAREQFVKDGYIIEKKAFHDTVEKNDDKLQAEMRVQYSLHCRVQDGTRHAVMNWQEFQKLARKFIDIGKTEALKDLPRWKDNWDSLRPYKDISGLQYIVLNGRAMNVSDLTKLPGFKED